MAGLLGSLIAGGAKGYAQGKIEDAKRQEEFDMKTALMDASVDKTMRLKELGMDLDQRKAQEEKGRVSGLLQTGRDAMTASAKNQPGGYDPQDPEGKIRRGYDELSRNEQLAVDQKTLMDNGEYDYAEKLGKFASDKKSFDSIKLDDGSVMAFDKSTGNGKIVFQGGGEIDVPKNEIELAWRESGGDPKKTGEILVKQKARIAAAGRAPEKMSDEDLTFADWKKKPENKGKGRDDYVEWKSSISKNADIGIQEVTEEPVLNTIGDPLKDKEGRIIMTRKVKRKERFNKGVDGGFSLDRYFKH